MGMGSDPVSKEPGWGSSFLSQSEEGDRLFDHH